MKSAVECIDYFMTIIQSLAIPASKLPAKAVKARVVSSMTSRLASFSPSMSSITDPTSQLAATICSIDYDALDSATVAAVKRLISDGIAVAIAGTGEAAPRIVSEHVRAIKASPDATVWGSGFKTSAQHAAYTNAVAMHVLDFEPMSNPSTHAVSPTVPVAFALAEARGAHGRDIIAACAKGFEAQGCVLAAAMPERGSLPFHTPGVIGVIGSAVTAGHILGLDAGQLANALGISASRAAGLPANTGSMVKSTHCGNAASAGVEAALLAARGFSANPEIFAAPRGYVETFFPAHFDYPTLLAFGNPYRCVDPGMAIKFYPSKYPTHFGVAAALEARQTISDPALIRSVHITTPDIIDANRPQPRGGLEGKFSFQYTVAAALLDGAVGITSFTDARRFTADMVDLLAKTSLSYDCSIPQDTRSMHVKVHVALNDGTTRTAICRKPPGTWGVPVDVDQHRAKIRDCLSVHLRASSIEPVVDLLDRLEDLTSHDIARLTALLV